MIPTLTLEQKLARSQKRLKVAEELANDPNLSPLRQRAARAFVRSQKVAVSLRERAIENVKAQTE